MAIGAGALCRCAAGMMHGSLAIFCRLSRHYRQGVVTRAAVELRLANIMTEGTVRQFVTGIIDVMIVNQASLPCGIAVKCMAIVAIIAGDKPFVALHIMAGSAVAGIIVRCPVKGFMMHNLTAVSGNIGPAVTGSAIKGCAADRINPRVAIAATLRRHRHKGAVVMEIRNRRTAIRLMALTALRIQIRRNCGIGVLMAHLAVISLAGSRRQMMHTRTAIAHFTDMTIFTAVILGRSKTGEMTLRAFIRIDLLGLMVHLRTTVLKRQGVMTAITIKLRLVDSLMAGLAVSSGVIWCAINRAVMHCRAAIPGNARLGMASSAIDHTCNNRIATSVTCTAGLAGILCSRMVQCCRSRSQAAGNKPFQVTNPAIGFRRRCVAGPMAVTATVAIIPKLIICMVQLGSGPDSRISNVASAAACGGRYARVTGIAIDAAAVFSELMVIALFIDSPGCVTRFAVSRCNKTCVAGVASKRGIVDMMRCCGLTFVAIGTVGIAGLSQSVTQSAVNRGVRSSKSMVIGTFIDNPLVSGMAAFAACNLRHDRISKPVAILAVLADRRRAMMLIAG